MRGRIFINYRREDSGAEARSIFQRLERTFGRGRLFIDIDSIQKGRDFAEVLDEHLEQSEVMLVLIGRRWIVSQDEHRQNRLDDPDDFVRLEIAHALRRGILVIPVLVDRASMPKSADLPEDIKPLSRRQASIVTHENFARDMDGLEFDLKASVKPRTRLNWIAFGLAVVALGFVAMIYQSDLQLRTPKALMGQPEGKPGDRAPKDTLVSPEATIPAGARDKQSRVERSTGSPSEPVGQKEAAPRSNRSSPSISTELTGKYAAFGGWGEGKLEIRTNPDGSQYFSTDVWFENGHNCALSGTASPVAQGWRYMDGSTCILEIRRDGNRKVKLETEPGASCSDYCGARGSLDDITFRKIK